MCVWSGETFCFAEYSILYVVVRYETHTGFFGLLRNRFVSFRTNIRNYRTQAGGGQKQKSSIFRTERNTFVSSEFSLFFIKSGHRRESITQQQQRISAYINNRPCRTHRQLHIPINKRCLPFYNHRELSTAVNPTLQPKNGASLWCVRTSFPCKGGHCRQ